MKINDPECGERTFTISYRIDWVESNEHYTMKVQKNSLRENVDGNIINISNSTSEWTYAHEFAHCFGLPDEYGYYAVDDDYVVYIKPDGSRSTPILAPITPIDPAASSATIMSAHGLKKVEVRHAWQVAIEVQNILRKKLVERSHAIPYKHLSRPCCNFSFSDTRNRHGQS